MNHIPAHDNPIYWQEKNRLARSRPIQRLFRWVYIIYGVVFIFIVIWAIVDGISYRNEDEFIDWLVFWYVLAPNTLFAVSIGQAASALFFVPTLTAGAIATESKQNSLELLFLTPLQSKQIIFGKARATLPLALKLVFFLAPIAFALLPISRVLNTHPFPIGRVFSPWEPGFWWEGLILILIPQFIGLSITFFSAFLTLYLSTYFEEVTLVIVTTYGTLLAIGVSSALISLLFDNTNAYFLSPIPSFLYMFYDRSDFNSTLQAVLCALLYGTLSYVLYHLTIQRMQQLAGRLPHKN